MANNRPAPGWGKTIGILMIIFGALGVFIQIYKIVIPQILMAQRGVMNTFSTIETGNQPNPFRATQPVFNDMMSMSNSQVTTLLICGILGFIGCVFYIIAGAKLLTANPKNYYFGRTTLIAFLSLNILTIILLVSGGASFILMVILVYVIMGLVIDLVLFIILVSSDKTKYGIGVDSSDIVYSAHQSNDEVI